MTRSRRWWATPFSLSIVAIAMVAGCSQASKSHGQPGLDGGADASACGDDCEADAGADAGLVDTGWVCPIVPGTSAGASCDACIQSSCDAVWCTCAEDKFGNEAGVPGCFGYLTCLQSCAADGGVPTDGGDGGPTGPCSECAPGTYSTAEQQEAQAVLACIAQSCATQCPATTTFSL
jgi:hypothetical protein